MGSFHHVLLLSAAAAAAAVSAKAPLPPKAHQLDASYTFDQYLAHFDKSYDDAAEHARHATAFDRNLAKILRHNAGQDLDDAGEVRRGYVMGVNALTDLEPGELPLGYNKLLHEAWSSQLKGGAASAARRLGAADTDAMASYSQAPNFVMDKVSDLPKTVDWTDKVGPVPNQGGCGSCWTFAATAAVESQLAIAADADAPFVTLSQQTMLQCTPNPEQCGGTGKCDGATVELGLNYMADLNDKKTGGMYTIQDVPYTGTEEKDCATLTQGKTPYAGVTGWVKLPTNNYTAVMNAVDKIGPLAIAVAANDWSMYGGGIFDGTGTEVNHAVLLVGYGETDAGEKFWKVRNSWGSGFGESGYIRLKRTDGDDTNCPMDGHPLLGVACALDENGNTINVMPVEVCGTSTILFDVAYPTGVTKLG